MHLYKPDGTPVYEVPYANPRKGMRKATLADAKKMGLVPSVTTILQILDKPGLNNWLQDRVLESALTLPRAEGESDQDYIARVKRDSQEISNAARDEGTRIHDALESAFKGRVVDRQYLDLSERVKAEIYSHFKTSQGWIAEHSFAHPIGYGGKIDILNRDINVVLDFKTKEVLEDGQKYWWDEHIMQLAAYAHGVGMDGAMLVNVFVGYDGKTIIHEWTDHNGDITRGYHMFMAALRLWKLQKRYDPVEFKDAA